MKVVRPAVDQEPKRCIPYVIMYEWFFNRRPPVGRRIRRGSRW